VNEQTVIAEQAQAAVRELRSQARYHKRESNRHRRSAADIMTKLDDIRRKCAAVGIVIIIEEPEAESHGHRSNP
jgi:hypothetical protein